MTWEFPQALYLLWLAPLWVALALYARAKRRRAAEAFIAAPMQGKLLPPEQPWRFWSKTLLGAAALVCGLLALARPRWGEYFMELRPRGADLYVLLDVSRSMLAEDVAPSRLERAKADIKTLLGRLQGERVGLIAFAGRPTVRSPLTSDYGFFRLVLEETGPGSAPRGGTNIGDAIRKALEVLPKDAARDQALLVITDGGDQESFPLDAADAASERKVPIFTVGLGDATQGARVPDRKPGTWVTHDGQQVWSKLDTSLLGELARRTSGAFVAAGTQSYDLGQIYTERLANLRGEAGTELRRKRQQEQFQIFVGLALLFLLLDLLILAYPPREHASAAKNADKEKGRGAGAKHGAARAAKQAVTAMCLLLACLAGRAGSAEPSSPEKSEAKPPVPGEPQASKDQRRDAPALVAEGLELYKKNEYAGAREKFAAATNAARIEEAAVVAFNLGVAQQKQGDREAAMASYEQASASQDRRILVAARYNLGVLEAEHARKLGGEKPESLKPAERQPVLEALERAVKHLRETLELDPGHAGARKNIELLREWVKHYLEVWRKKDRDDRRRELDLLKYLEYLVQTQETLRAAGQELARTHETPLDAWAELKRAQDELAEEIQPLKEKIALDAAPPAQPGQPAPPLDEETQKAIAVLQGWADEAGKAMDRAAGRLEVRDSGGAGAAQFEAAEKLGAIWDAAAPFRALLEHALQTQTELARKLEPDPAAAQGPAVPVPLVDAAWKQETERLAEVQDRTRRRTVLMRDKAAVELDTLRAQPPQVAPAPQPGQPAGPDPEKIKQGLQKAVDLAPRAVKHQESAHASLKREARTAAWPDAEEARKILEEIMKAQPQDEQKQGQQKDEQQQDQKDQQEQNKQDQQKKDQKQDQKSGESQDEKKSQDDGQGKSQDRKDEKKSEGEGKSGGKQQDKKSQEPQQGDKKTEGKSPQPGQEPKEGQGGAGQPREMTKEQAEAILRRVQERERERRRRYDELKVRIGGSEPVDKDW